MTNATSNTPLSPKKLGHYVHPTTTTTNTPTMSKGFSSSVWKKLVLLGLIGFALWMLCNDEFSVMEALSRHEPSARVFRSLGEVNLILFATSLSIYVWSKTIGLAMVARLLFYYHAPTKDSSSSADYDTIQEQESLLKSEYGSDEDDHVVLEGDTGIHARRQYRNELSAGVLDIDNDYDSDVDISSQSGVSLRKTHSSDGNVHRGKDDSDSNHDRHVHVSIPSAVSILNAALDLLLLVLVALFLFSWSALGLQTSADEDDYNGNGSSMGSHWIHIASRVAAPAFPLLLFAKLAAITIFNPKRRPFWNVLLYTVAAPLYPVTFRDGFIGDVLTSSVRPLQDIVFTLIYMTYGLQGWWSQSYYMKQPVHQMVVYNETTTIVTQEHVNLDATVLLPAMEKSWLLHTILLPLCVVLPLWWRFLQNLRQVYDERQRWPYLGNALKYFLAAQVAVFGVYQPHWQTSPFWLSAFVVATLYQTYWDVFMDWGLLERTNASGGWQLRKERLYNGKCMYWTIALVNCVLRFCWTLSFIPQRYLDPAGVLIQQNNLIMGPTLASAEIIRRTLWGWLRFEYEAIKVQAGSMNQQRGLACAPADQSGEMKPSSELAPMKLTSHIKSMRDCDFDPVESRRLPAWNDMSSMNDIQVLSELGMYAALFVTGALVAAAHRGTL